MQSIKKSWPIFISSRFLRDSFTILFRKDPGSQPHGQQLNSKEKSSPLTTNTGYFPKLLTRSPNLNVLDCPEEQILNSNLGTCFCFYKNDPLSHMDTIFGNQFIVSWTATNNEVCGVEIFFPPWPTTSVHFYQARASYALDFKSFSLISHN